MKSHSRLRGVDLGDRVRPRTPPGGGVRKKVNRKIPTCEEVSSSSIVREACEGARGLRGYERRARAHAVPGVEGCCILCVVRVALFFNLTAGRGRARSKRIEVLRAVERRAREVVVVDSESAALLTASVAELSRKNFDRLILCGGDGTLHRAIQQADLNKGTFAIVPLGSGDDFASAVSIPLESSAAVRCAFEGEIREFDVGLAGSHRFLGSVSLGFDARVAERVAKTKWLRGALLYVGSTLRELPSFRPLSVTLEVDGERREKEVMFLVVANSPRYGGGVLIAPDAQIDDGFLDLITVEKASKLDLLLTFPSAYRGAHLRKKFITAEKLRVVRIDTERAEKLYADGEPIGNTPVTVALAESRLRLIVPRANAQ